MIIIAYFASWMPFWNSLDDVRRIHSGLSLASVIFFVLLAFFDALSHWSKDKNKERKWAEIGIACFVIAVLCELAAYPYGERNDTLSERKIVSLNELTKDAETKATKAVTDSGTALAQAGQATSLSTDAIAKAKTLGETVDKVAARAKNALNLAEKDSRRPTELEVAMLEMGSKSLMANRVGIDKLKAVAAEFPNQRFCLRALDQEEDPTHAVGFMALSISAALVLTDPKWIESCIDDPGSSASPGPPVPKGIRTGVYVMSDANDRTKRAARALIEGLKVAHVLPEYEDRALELPRRRKYAFAPPSDVIIIAVGEHP
ncbi:hypothetical protein [Granulicella sibirica]|uniref:hypothetical protein n=1 Tax=Granulicella sibirica TaxID=2479048 RepID=UPI00100925B0|nr:hypothetical protein [Granulicella sibirica]